MFGIDFCDVKLLLAQVFLKTPTLHAVTAEVIELNNRKNLKKASFISSQRTIAKSEKVLKNYTRFKHELKITFFLIFYAKQRRLKRWGKTVG